MNSLVKKENGFSLVEVLVGLVIIGIIAAGFLLAIATAYKANIIADERTTADSLARAQMESVKAQTYIEAEDDSEVIYIKLAVIPDGYEIWSVNRTGETEDIIGVPWDSQNGTAAVNDDGLQKIKLIIKHNGKEVLTLEDYKVDR